MVHTKRDGDCIYVGSCTVAADNFRKQMDALFARGIQGVVLKQGSRGVYLGARDGMNASIPAFPVMAIDTTGAGDAFNGAFATGLMLGKTPTESALFGAAAAAISVTRQGAQPSMASREETEALLERLHEECTSGAN